MTGTEIRKVRHRALTLILVPDLLSDTLLRAIWRDIRQRTKESDDSSLFIGR